ncbi:S-type Pyocin [Pseudomonas sp. JV414]|uniref:S-type pyocin domain-containing protein n=1 Tax=Pseudomonas sp. JV414 TaxID=1733110 RepID=UPI0028E0AE79|nr:S-type pyocin domain-containing protein [Pseudomonas sp. JV414]MDT9675008.1 S-type Pyocin [Pseudomonas sp. JV414]
MQKPPLILDATHITAKAPDNWDPFKDTTQGYSFSGMFGPAGANHKTREIMYNTQIALEQEFGAKSTLLPQSIEAELAATRLEGPTHPLPPAAALVRELGVRNTLIQRKTAELHRQTAIANRFYGSDPLGKKFNDFLNQASAIRRTDRSAGTRELWSQSYRAAHEARLLSQAIQLLNQQQVNVLNWLAAVQAEDQARAAAEQEAHRAAAELARINEQARLAALAGAARLAAERERVAAEERRQEAVAEAARLQKEQEEIRNREQARIVALAEAQRMAVEQARLAAEAAARQLAAEQASIAALADLQRRKEAEKARIERENKLQAEKTRLERQQKALKRAQRRKRKQARKNARAEAERQAEQSRLHAQWQAETEARWQRPTFANVGSMTAFGPAFTGTLGSFGNNPTTALALRTALRTGVSLAVAALSTATAPVLVGFATLLVPSSLGNGDLYSASVPLSDLAPDLTADLHELAATEGEVDLPVRLGSRTIGNRVEIVIVSTDGVTVPANVPVRTAHFDAKKNVYVSTASDSIGPILTWTPLVDPLNPSTDFPLVDTELPIYEGANVTPDGGRIDPFPQLDQYGFGGFITVFPIESGIPPTFTMFRDRRQDPGIATGNGQPVSENWLGAASTLQGAPIPEQIADRLRGREFSSFKAFRRAFWKAVAADSELSSQLSRLSKIETEKGLAARADQADHVGKKRKFDLHHVIPISEGGAVYEIDNLRVLTPKQHIKTHSKNREL